MTRTRGHRHAQALGPPPRLTHSHLGHSAPMHEQTAACTRRQEARPHRPAREAPADFWTRVPSSALHTSCSADASPHDAPFARKGLAQWNTKRYTANSQLRTEMDAGRWFGAAGLDLHRGQPWRPTGGCHRACTGPRHCTRSSIESARVSTRRCWCRRLSNESKFRMAGTRLSVK